MATLLDTPFCRFIRRKTCCLGVMLFALVGAARVLAQSDSNSPRWTFSAGKSTAILSSPAVGPDHTVYFGVEKQTTPMTGFVLAVNSDGSTKWVFPKAGAASIEEIEGAPALSANGAMLYIGCADGRLYALSTADGSLAWSYDTGRTSAIFCDPALGADGTIYVGSTNLQTVEDSVLYAIWPDGTKRWVVSAAGTIEGAPSVALDGTVYFGAGQNIYAVGPNGDYKIIYSTAGLIFAAPAIGADGTLYIGSDGNDFLALSPQGKVKWTFAAKIGAGAAIGADGTIYVGTTDGLLYALQDKGSQAAVRWTFTASGSILSIPAIRADGTIIFTSFDGTIHALNSDGSEKWSRSVGDEIETSPVVDTDGRIYIGSSGGIMYSFFGSGSPLSQLSPWPMFSRDIAHDGRAVPPISGGRLVNLGTRGQGGPGLDLIAGFVLQGSTPKPLLLRAIGPTLSLLGVAHPMADPTLSVHTASSFTPTFNDNWQTNPNADSIAATAEAVGAFGLPTGSKDAAILGNAATTGATNYTMTIDSADGGTGVVLMEAYDAATADPNTQLVNLSSRGHVGTGENVLIPGIVIGGEGKLHVLVRAVGPGLVQLGVPAPSVLTAPKLQVFDRQSNLVASNTGWTSSLFKGDLAGAASLVGAFPLPVGSADSALILSLDPGQYTFLASGADGGTGEALVEVYALPY